MYLMESCCKGGDGFFLHFIENSSLTFCILVMKIAYWTICSPVKSILTTTLDQDDVILELIREMLTIDFLYFKDIY